MFEIDTKLGFSLIKGKLNLYFRLNREFSSTDELDAYFIGQEVFCGTDRYNIQSIDYIKHFPPFLTGEVVRLTVK